MRLSYALITPARNEGENLRRLASCLARQTARPSSWIVVDDGSTDDSRTVIGEFAALNPWAEAIESPAAELDASPLILGRRSGRDVIAFKAGLNAVRDWPDILVKLDADVSFEDDFFERLLAEFGADPRLGLCSGLCLELEAGEWRAQYVTRLHVRGATRAYRRECLEQVSPLVEQLGWDGIDEIKAQLLGWHVRTLEHVPFRHHRRMGERDGRRQSWESQGATAWFLGYRFSYLFLRAMFRARKDPLALALLLGWLKAAVRRQPRYLDREVRDYLRSQQRLRELRRRSREALGRPS